jgi:hypothetical protein
MEVVMTMIRKFLLALVLGLALVTPARATALVTNIPISTPGVLATATLAGQAINAWVEVSIQSPGTGDLVIDVDESTDGGQTWNSYNTFGCTGDVYPPNNYGLPVGANTVCGFGARLLVNTATTQFRATARTVTGGVWTVLSMTVTS